MDYKFTDDTSTAEVVWAAAERIGKTDNAQDISRICEYLINKHWFQSAGDLRAAKENRPEWHALEIPGRLKIAIQDILDSSLDMPMSGNLVLPSTEVTNELRSQPTDEGTANTAAETCTGIGTNANAETSVVYNGVGESHAHPSFGSHDPNYHYSSAEAEYAQDAAQQAAYAAAWDAYYAAIAYNAESEKNAVEYSTEYPTTLQSDYSTSVVEAHEVVVEGALVVEVEPFEPEVPVFSSDVVEYSYGSEGALTSWKCGQCTFMNTFDVAFCEVCCGHISLSLDAQSTSNPGEPTNDHQLKGNFTSQSDDIGEAELIEKRADLVPGTAARSIPFSDVDPALVLPLPATHCGTIPTRPYVLEPPLFVSIPSPTKPMAPIYNPTAPDLDLEEDVAHSGDNRLNDHDLAHLKISPAVNTEESTLPKIDYCALAFNRIPAGSSTNATETVVSGHRTTEFI